MIKNSISKPMHKGLELHYEIINDDTINIKLPPRCGPQGFFCCCSIKLNLITEYINFYKKIPKNIISNRQFILYKSRSEMENNEDITSQYFEINEDVVINYIEPFIFSHDDQFSNFKNLNFNLLNPIIKKYFTPNKSINNLVNIIETKYNIEYENTCAIFYRGNDKMTEMNLPSYKDFADHADLIKFIDNNIKFLIQSDETEFIQTFMERYSGKSFFFKDEIRHINRQINTVDLIQQNTNNYYSKLFLSIMIIMSKCKYVICNSGNCSMWISLFRGNADNIIQEMNGKWV